MLSLIYILNKMLKFILLVSSSALLTACIVVESPVPVVVNKEITTIDNPSIPALNSLRTLQIRTHDNRCVELSPSIKKNFWHHVVKVRPIKNLLTIKIKA